MQTNNSPVIIGRAEKVYLIDYLKIPVIAKVDTGADLSSVWATDVRERDGILEFRLFGPESPAYTGETIVLPAEAYSITRIANSFGERELRYLVKLRIKLAGRVVRASFTLADRSKKTYPMLIGRRLLQGKFIVDVAKGRPLRKEEKEKQAKMRLELEAGSDKLGE